MPLIQSKSKKALKQNIKTEMDANPGPEHRAQNLAIAFSVKRKPKKKASGGTVESGSRDMNMAEGGEVNAKNERRPMPDNRYDDSKMVSRNSGNKPAKNDSWTDNSTITQAQKPSPTKLSRPKLVGSDAFSVRYKDEIDEDLDRMNSMPPETDTAPPPKRDDEIGAKRQGPDVRDMQSQHNNSKPPYNKAIEDQYAQDMAAAEMKKQQSYARGGPVMQPKDHAIELMERDDEADLQSMADPSEDEGTSFARGRNEEGPNRQGDEVPDMEDEHSTGRKPYAEGGMTDTGNSEDEMKAAATSQVQHDYETAEHKADQEGDRYESYRKAGMTPPEEGYARGGKVSPEDEEQEEHHNSVAAAIMAKEKRQSHLDSDSDIDDMVMMADGGILSHGSMDSDLSDQADLSRNADEDANEEDQASFDALRKENYSESEGLEELDNPMDSAQTGDDEEADSENEHDMVSSIRRKMNSKRQFRD